MNHAASLVIWMLFVKFATCFGDDSCDLDIILRSGMSSSSGRRVNGKTVDILTDDVNVTLEAHFDLKNTTTVQVKFNWYKNGTAVNVSRINFRQRFCGPPSALHILNCSFILQLSNVNDGVSGNYSLMMYPPVNVCTPAWVTVIAGRAQLPEFTTFPDPVVNCSANSTTVTLLYESSGFPRPTYSVNCSNLLYESNSSESGVFVLPSELCCSNVRCQAVASNAYHSPVLSSVTKLTGSSNRPGCPQPPQGAGLNIVLWSSISATSGRRVNGKTIEILADDTSVTLEATLLINITGFVRVQLIWFKNGTPVNVSSPSIGSRFCEGSPPDDGRLVCLLELPLSSVSDSLPGNYSGNYSVVTLPADIGAPAFVTIIAHPPLSHVFLVYPPAVTDADAYGNNGSVALQYTAAGALAYSLHCNSSPSAGGVASRSNFSSASGNFTIPPLSCGANTTCYAVASFDLGESIVSPVTLLLASTCRPTAVQAIEGLQNILLIVITIVSITVLLILIAAIILLCRRRGRCLVHQSKLCTGERQVDIGMAQADHCTKQHCQKKLQESCSDNSEIGANPNDKANAIFHQQGLCGQTPTYFYPPGTPLFTQPFVTKLSNSGDGTGSLETDGDDSSPVKTGQPSCSVSWVTSDYGVSNDPVSMPLERYPSAANSSTVIVISAGTVQLGNGNIMVINGCSNETDHVSVSLPDCPSEPTPEAEHTLVPGSWMLSDSSTLLEPHSAAFNDCLSPDVS